MPTTSTYLQRIEGLFREAEALFVRIKGGEKCDELIPAAIALDARFDDAGEDLLQGIYKEVEAKIYAKPDGEPRMKEARRLYKVFRGRGVAFGPQYWRVDRIARVCYRNYKDGENELYRGLATKRDYVIDTMKDVHDWMYHYATTISEWWNMGDFGKLHTPRAEAESINHYLTKDISTRTYSTLMHVLRPSTPRPQYQWEAIARIIYDSPYFKRMYKSVKYGRKKAMSFSQWCKFFTRLVGIPDFVQRPGNKQVAEEIERLKRMSGKDGGLKFLLTKPNKKRP